MGIFQNLKSDFYQFFHSPLLLIHLVIPLVGILLFLWSVSFSAWSEINKLSGYIQLLSCTFPVVIAAITSILSDFEQKAGSFYTLLSAPAPKYLPHLTKITMLLCFGFCSTLLALVGFGIGFRAMGYCTFGLSFYLQTAILLSISVLPLYPLHYIMSFVLGNGYSLGLGFVGSLLSALFLTGLGNGIWSFLPWGIAARFSDSLLITRVMDIDFFTVHGMIQGILFLCIFLFVFSALFLLLFSHWDGRKTED